jgi:hypothetical protein
MMMKIGKVIIVIMPFLQDLSQAIMKVKVEVKAIPKKRLMLSQRQSKQKITERENKKKNQKGSSKIKKTTSQRNRFCRGFSCRREHCSNNNSRRNNRYCYTR